VPPVGAAPSTVTPLPAVTTPIGRQPGGNAVPAGQVPAKA